MTERETEFIDYLKKKGGLASYAEIIEAGFSKDIVKSSLESELIHKMDRGLYTLSEGSSFPQSDLLAISLRVPHGVVCLVSALSFHMATKEIPRQVDIAIARGSHANKIKYPPVKYYRFDPKIWKAGIEEHKIEGQTIKVYNLARTVADCFKFRNKVGVDVAREALKTAVDEKRIKPREILEYAKICRVDRIIKPILEVMI